MSPNRMPVGRKDGLVVQELNGELLVYDMQSHKACCMNESSALIWKACDGTRDIAQLRDYASVKMNAKLDDDFVWLALDQLKKENLVDFVPEPAQHFAGLSRREVMKRIGIASAIALPIITGLVAPQAAHAQSICGAACNPGNNPCTNAACPTCSAGKTCV